MASLDPTRRALVPSSSRSVLTKIVASFFTVVGLVACVGADADFEDEDEDFEDGDGETISGEEVGVSSDAQTGPGPCAGTAIHRAIQCAQRKGARVLSFYRSPAEQERVRRQNKCTNRCTGGAGCIRPTAGCTTSPHTRCRAVDLVNDGAPVSRAELRKCGLAKTTAPHRNHYDLVN